LCWCGTQRSRILNAIWYASLNASFIRYLTLVLKADLSQTIQNFLNITARCSPSILISKPKFHFLVHLPAFIRRFGPAIIFSTERYESFNHVFRLSAIYSNRRAPSRDTCRSFASQDIIKHIATGGFWLDNKTGKWVHAGGHVLEYMSSDAAAWGLIGVPRTVTINPGTRVPCQLQEVAQCFTGGATVEYHSRRGRSRRQVVVIPAVQSLAAKTGFVFRRSLFRKGKSFVTRKGDIARIGSTVVSFREGNTPVCSPYGHDCPLPDCLQGSDWPSGGNLSWARRIPAGISHHNSTIRLPW
jgi:hypothetical protein